MSLLGKTTKSGDDERAFLQRRVAAFGRFVGLLFGIFWVYRWVVVLINGGTLDWTMYWHAVAVLSMLVAWLLCRSGSRSHLNIHVIETVSLLFATAAIAAMTMKIPLWEVPNLVLVLVLTIVFFARAVFVPSSARRSLILALVAGVLILVTVYLAFAAIDLRRWAALDPTVSGRTASAVAIYMAVYAGAYWAITTVLTSAASKIIYGLRRQVRDARQLGQYRLEEKIGEGGMGMVYRASHALLRRPTAVKLLLPERAGEKSLERFEREVQLTAGLSHPNTINIFDYGHTPDGIFYYAMELIDGATLSQVVELTRAQPPARVIHILQQAAAALVEAHDIGLIHRDIKPANIMIHRGAGVADLVKVLDFGLVKELEQSKDVGLTGDGNLTGSPQYMSPEAIKAPDTVGPSTDIYALGAVGYFLITGEHLFTGSSIVEVCSQHLTADPEPPSERLGKPVPAELEELILACLKKEPAARPKSAIELLRRLDNLGDTKRWSPRDANEWWEEYGPALENERRSTQDTSMMTLEIGRLREQSG